MDDDTSFTLAAIIMTLRAVDAEHYADAETNARAARCFREQAGRDRREVTILLNAVCQRVWPDGCS